MSPFGTKGDASERSEIAGVCPGRLGGRVSPATRGKCPKDKGGAQRRSQGMPGADARTHPDRVQALLSSSVTYADGNLVANWIYVAKTSWSIAMFRSDQNKRDVKSIATPVVSFALLGVLIVGAVMFGNLLVEPADGCRPLGTSTENDGPVVIVVSDDDDGLMLCDVPQESVEYVPPQREPSAIRVGDSTYVLQLTYDDWTHDQMSREIEGSDLTIDEDWYPPEGNFLWESNTSRTPVYVKGEYGSIEDCGFDDLYASGYKSDDFDGFDGSDMFHPDRVQSCWIEIDYYSSNGG